MLKKITIVKPITLVNNPTGTNVNNPTGTNMNWEIILQITTRNCIVFWQGTVSFLEVHSYLEVWKTFLQSHANTQQKYNILLTKEEYIIYHCPNKKCNQTFNLKTSLQNHLQKPNRKWEMHDKCSKKFKYHSLKVTWNRWHTDTLLWKLYNALPVKRCTGPWHKCKATKQKNTDLLYQGAIWTICYLNMLSRLMIKRYGFLHYKIPNFILCPAFLQHLS